MTAVRLYTRRQLTNEIDILKAGAGFLRRVGENMKSPVFQGLPTSIFDFALLSRRQHWSKGPDQISPRRVQFPSFSWAGWRGEAFWDLEDASSSYEVLNMGTPESKRFNDWLNHHTWIEYYELHPNNHTTRIWPVSEQESFSQLAVDFLGYRSREAPPFYLAEPTTEYKTGPTTTFPQPVRQYPVLQFWTMAAWYNMIQASPQYIKLREATASWQFNLLDRSNQVCGRIILDEIPSIPYEGPQEFLILSESSKNTSESYSHYRKRIDISWGCVKQRSFTDSEILEWNYFWVMLIVRDELGVAERRGLGKIVLSSLDYCCEAGPVWKEIILG
jgi:hypothetical protein